MSTERSPLRALLVEDNPDDGAIILRALSRGGFDVEHERVETAADLRTAISRHNWDVVIADYTLPAFSGPEAFVLARQQEPHLPFILVSGAVGEETVADAMRQGINDYLMKDNLTRLPSAVNRAIQACEERKLREEAERSLRRRIDHLGALRTIDRAIAGSLDLKLTLDVVLDQVTGQLGVDAARILLLNPLTQKLEYTAGRGFSDASAQSVALRMGEDHAGRAALERRPVHVPDLRSARFPGGFPERSAPRGFVGYYALPLIAKNDVKGVLETFSRTAVELDEEWREFAGTLAGQAAIAIDNARMLTDLTRSNTELRLAYETTLEGWSRALDLRDNYTQGHTARVADLAVLLGRALGMDPDEIHHLRRGALLHDIGKMGIPDSILLKPAPLTDEEWEVMRMHPVYAYELLSPIAYLRPALDIPHLHHERWDGGGYPLGLKGEEIPLAARVFAVVDAWDTLTSRRPYQDGVSDERAKEILRKAAGAEFDPRIVKAFLELDLSGAEPVRTKFAR